MSTIKAKDATGSTINAATIGPVTVTSARIGNYYATRSLFVYGRDAVGRPVEIICHPEFEFELA